MADKTPAAAGAVARPGVLSLNIREKAALYAAYMPFLKGGGIFIPTSRPYSLGEEVFMLLSLMDDPNRIAVQGKVVWITPDGGQGNRTQGIGVQFTLDDTGAAAKATIARNPYDVGIRSQKSGDRSQPARAEPSAATGALFSDFWLLTSDS